MRSVGVTYPSGRPCGQVVLYLPPGGTPGQETVPSVEGSLGRKLGSNRQFGGPVAGRVARRALTGKGAEGGIRTRTSRSSQPCEDCVSTNFTTLASSVSEAACEPAAKGL